jgi:hypothetical protein
MRLLPRRLLQNHLRLQSLQPVGGKLQQMAPILLIVTIVLLVAVLVTVLFVMKH